MTEATAAPEGGDAADPVAAPPPEVTVPASAQPGTIPSTPWPEFQSAIERGSASFAEVVAAWSIIHGPEGNTSAHPIDFDRLWQAFEHRAEDLGAIAGQT